MSSFSDICKEKASIAMWNTPENHSCCHWIRWLNASCCIKTESMYASMKFLRLLAPSTMLTGSQRLKPVQSDAGLQVTARLTYRDRKTCSNIHHLESAVYHKCISLKCGKGNRHRKRLLMLLCSLLHPDAFQTRFFKLLFSMIIKTKFWMITDFQWKPMQERVMLKRQKKRI